MSNNRLKDVIALMEPDRYQQNHVSYIAGLFCLITSLGLFAFCLFLLPYLFFDWQYNVPDFITDFRAWLQSTYEVSKSGTTWVLCFILTVPAAILFTIADVLSNKIDKHIYGISTDKTGTLPKDSGASVKIETRGLVLKMVLIIIVIFVVTQFFHWVISTSA